MRINGSEHTVPEAWRQSNLLSYLRDHLGLTGTKYGCGKGLCGACTVHIDGKASRACLLPLRALEHADITTIEGLATDVDLHPVQQAWIDVGVPQCGYCQAGQIMTAAAYLEDNPAPTLTGIQAAMSGNLCRCGTYGRIQDGVLRAAEIAREAS